MVCINGGFRLSLLFLGCLASKFGYCSSSSCDKSLLWNKRYSAGASTYNLQVCCGVSKIWAAKVESPWKIVEPAAIDQVPVGNLSLFHDELLISVCGTEVFEGAVFEHNGRKCQQKNGNFLQIQDNSNAALYGTYEGEQDASEKPKEGMSYKGFKDNFWYVFCYQLQDSCYNCSLELFCSSRYHADCMKIWMDRSVGKVTNDSMQISVTIGETLPFSDVKLSLSVLDQSRQEISFAADNVLVKQNSTTTMTADNLNPGKWYNVEVCLEFVIPEPVLGQLSEKSLHQTQRHCLEDQAYRLLSNGAVASRCALAFICFLVLLVSMSV